MKFTIVSLGVTLLMSSPALAQEQSSGETGSEASASETVTPAPAPAAEEAPPAKKDERGVYYKKVQGWLWMEALVGPSTYDPDSFTSLSLSGVPTGNAPKLNGPEYGFAVGLGLGGFWLGGFYRQANYGQYKLAKVGLDIQGVFRFIPYVHPMVRIDMFYSKTFSGNPYGLSDANVDGGGFTLGAGLRIPIIRWMSFAATVDWSMIGLAIRSNNQKSGVLGQQIGATFALTFHFIGVRRN